MKKSKLQLLLTLLFLLCFVPLVYAVDTTETFAPGILTDYELYYGYSWDGDSNKAHAVEFLIGGGFTESLSYLVTGGYSKEIPDEGDSISVYGGIGIGLIWTIIDKKDQVSLDLLPAFTFEPNNANDDGTKASPNFKGYSYGGSIELNITLLPVFQPFLLAGITKYHKTEEVAPDEYEDGIDEYPLTLGFVIPIKEGMEFLAALDWTLNEDTKKWNETERTVAVGFNVMIADKLELITEVGRSLKVEDENGNEVSSPAWGIAVGFIYAL